MDAQVQKFTTAAGAQMGNARQEAGLSFMGHGPGFVLLF